MTKCVICESAGQKYKYYKTGAICSIDYIDFIEFMLSRYNLTDEEVQSSFEEYKISLDPEPEKKRRYPEPTPYNNPFRMGM